MFTEPSREIIEQLPPLKQVRRLPPIQRVIHLHFVFLSYHWYVAAFVEKVADDTVLFGFVNLDDPIMAEWGDFTLCQLRELQTFTNLIDVHTGRRLCRIPIVTEWDQEWRPRPFGEIDWRNGQ